MPDEKERQVTVGIQFPKDIRKWLDEKKDEQGTSLSHVVRALARKAMQEEAAEKEKL